MTQHQLDAALSRRSALTLGSAVVVAAVLTPFDVVLRSFAVEGLSPNFAVARAAMIEAVTRYLTEKDTPAADPDDRSVYYSPDGELVFGQHLEQSARYAVTRLAFGCAKTKADRDLQFASPEIYEVVFGIRSSFIEGILSYDCSKSEQGTVSKGCQKGRNTANPAQRQKQ